MVTALVLSGGGSRGAYQAGCWRALEEAGIDPELVVGTSVGAINGALIAQRTPWQSLWDLWRGLRQQDVLRLRRDVWRLWRWQGLYDASPMRRRIEEHLDADALRAGRRLLVTAVDVDSGEHVTFEGPDLKPEHFMASAALMPGLPAVTIDGRRYADGGLAQNPPLRPAIEAGARDVYALLHDPVEHHGGSIDGHRAALWRVSDITWHHRLHLEVDLLKARQALPRRHAMHVPETRVTWLAPSRPIEGDMLRFDPEHAARLLEAGYRETQRRLR